MQQYPEEGWGDGTGSPAPVVRTAAAEPAGAAPWAPEPSTRLVVMTYGMVEGRSGEVATRPGRAGLAGGTAVGSDAGSLLSRT